MLEKSKKNHILGWLLLVLITLFYLSTYWFCNSVAVPVIEARREREKTYTIRHNLRLVGKAMIDYANDHNGYLPTNNSWCDLMLEYDKNLRRENFSHPDIKDYVIAYNKHLSGKRLSDIPPKTIMLFEIKGGWNLSGGQELYSIEGFNMTTADILYVDQTMDIYFLKYGKLETQGVFNDTFFDPQSHSVDVSN